MGISSRFVARILGTDDDEGSGCKCLVFLGATCMVRTRLGWLKGGGGLVGGVGLAEDV